MFVTLPERERLQYEKLFVSCADLSFAHTCLTEIVRKQWQGMPWSRRGRVYERQKVYTTTFVICYCRPFTDSDGWPHIPSKLMRMDEDERRCHRSMLDRRNAVYAHTQASEFTVKPWKVRDFRTDVVGEPVALIDEADSKILGILIPKLISAFQGRMEEILESAEKATNRD